MPNYTFKEILGFFSDKFRATPPEEDLERGGVELVIDGQHVIFSKGKLEGGLHMEVVLGLILQPLRDDRLKDLATSNFLGINTGGCKLAFDETGVSLSLRGDTTSGASPQDNWEWLHRLLSVAREWNKVLVLWDEFVPLVTHTQEKKNEHSPKRSYKA
ncbi:MAG TPA: type III secretion system chaperone [Waddliaceae bacterium]